jgi:hypothetical protein
MVKRENASGEHEKERTSKILVPSHRYHRPHRLRMSHEVVNKLKVYPYLGGPLQQCK